MYTWIDSTNNDGQVCRISTTDCFTFTAGTADRNGHYAAMTAIINHKFDTLNTNQAADILLETRDGNTANLDKALSPVGNLN